MDNNFNDQTGQTVMPGVNENPEASGQVQPETTAPDATVQPEAVTPNVAAQPQEGMQTGYVQPQGGMQTGYVQPQEGMQTGYVQPQEGMQTGYVQPQEGMQTGYVQPQEGMQTGYVQPQEGMQTGYVQPQEGMQTGYVQPQPQMAPAMGGNGGSGKPPKPPKQKKPMTKGKIAGIISGSVAAIALVVCGVIFLPKLFRSDKEVVLDAFEATFESDKEEYHFADLIDAETIGDKIVEEGGTYSSSVVFHELAGESSVEGLTLEYSYIYDPMKLLANYCFELYHENTSFFELIMTGDEEKTYFQVPTFVEGYFWLPNDRYMDALANSVFGEGMSEAGIDYPDVEIDHFIASKVKEEEPAEINSEYVNAAETIWDKATFEKQGNAKIDVNGKTVKAKEYYITIAKEDIKDVISDVMSGVKEEIVNDPQILEESGLDASMMDSYIAQVESILASAIKEDLVIKVYIVDDKVVKVTSENRLNLMGINLDSNFYMDLDEDFSGEFTFSVMGEGVGISWDIKDIHGNANGTITLDAVGEVLEIRIATKNEETDTSKVSEFTAVISYDGDDITFKSNSTINKSGKTFQGDFSLSGMGENMFDGSYSGSASCTAGESYTIYLDNFEMSVLDEPIVKLEASYGATAGHPEAIPVDDSLPMYQIENMTDSEFENIMLDNADNMLNWTNSLLTDDVGMYFIQLMMDMVDSFVDDYGYDDYYDYDDDYDYYDDYDDSYSDTGDEPILVSYGGTQVEILGCIDGFELDYACEYFVDYVNQLGDYLEYTIEEDMTVEEILSGRYEITDDMNSASVENYVAVDGADGVCYSYISYYSYDVATTRFTFAKEITPGLCLVVDVSYMGSAIDDFEPGIIPTLAQALDSQYYTILQ